MLMREYQSQIASWLAACFNAEVRGDKSIRNYRFLEEALELVQACGCTKERALELVDYVYGRPVGEPSQEVGGIMVTLAALCAANCIDLEAAAVTEGQRIHRPEIMDKIRAKQASKVGTSALPGTGLLHISSERKGTPLIPMRIEFLDEVEDYRTNSTGDVAVSNTYRCRKDMENCPRGTKVYLIGKGGVGVLAQYNGDPFWIEWAALPARAE